MITQTTNLNLIPGRALPRINAAQYDTGSRTLTFAIYNGDQRFTLTSGMTAQIQGRKPDKHAFEYAASVSTSNNTITADLTQQMTAVAGDVLCELVISKNSERIGTLNFILAVQEAPLNDDSVVSDSELPDIIALATAQMEAAAQSAEDAEAWAIGERNGEPVESGDETFNNNAKHFATQAADSAGEAYRSAENSASSANDALGSANDASRYAGAASQSAEAAAGSAQAAAAWSSHPPYIGANGNWWVYNTTTEQFEDSGIDASITVQIADITMLNYNETPYVTNTGTDTDPVFHLFIPKGANVSSCSKTSTSGLVDTYTMVFTDSTTCTFTVTNAKSITNIAKTSTSGLVDTYTITFNDGTTTTFTVTNGEQGPTGATGNGISSIAKTDTTGLVDTYTVTFTNGTTTTFTVTNGEQGPTGATGNGISSIAKTDTTGLVDTYTVTFTNGTTTTFTVTNAKSISTVEKTSTSGLVDTYTITFNDGTTTTFTVTNGEQGPTGATGNGILSIAKTGTSGLVDTYTITYTNGTTTTFTVTNGQDGTGATLSTLADVDISNLSLGDVLVYNNATSKWENKTLATVATSGDYGDLQNTPTVDDTLDRTSHNAIENAAVAPEIALFKALGLSVVDGEVCQTYSTT